MARRSYVRRKQHKEFYKKALEFLINKERLKKEAKIFNQNKEGYLKNYKNQEDIQIKSAGYNNPRNKFKKKISIKRKTKEGYNVINLL